MVMRHAYALHYYYEFAKWLLAFGEGGYDILSIRTAIMVINILHSLFKILTVQQID